MLSFKERSSKAAHGGFETGALGMPFSVGRPLGCVGEAREEEVPSGREFTLLPFNKYGFNFMSKGGVFFEPCVCKVHLSSLFHLHLSRLT